jgi:hypothetical protein
MYKNQLQRVTRAQAEKLLAAGFDWHVILLDNEYSFPTVALALKWMRDVKNLTGQTYRTKWGWAWETANADSGIYISSLYREDSFTTYEAAESAMLDELLTQIEKQNNP